MGYCAKIDIFIFISEFSAMESLQETTTTSVIPTQKSTLVSRTHEVRYHHLHGRIVYGQGCSRLQDSGFFTCTLCSVYKISRLSHFLIRSGGWQTEEDQGMFNKYSLKRASYCKGKLKLKSQILYRLQGIAFYLLTPLRSVIWSVTILKNGTKNLRNNTVNSWIKLPL